MGQNQAHLHSELALVGDSLLEIMKGTLHTLEELFLLALVGEGENGGVLRAGLAGALYFS